MRRTARVILTGVGAVLALLTAPTPAQAKVPPFSVEWSPRTPAAGEEITFTVRFWDDVAHTDRAGWVESRFLGDLLWVFPAGASDDAIRLELERARPGVFRGSAALPAPGTWSVCAWETSCPIGNDVPGYPGSLELTVLGGSTAAVVASSESLDAATGRAAEPSGSAELSGAEATSASWSGPAATGALAVVLAALAVGARRGSRRPPAAGPKRSRTR
jgi:hypothetical protein